MNKIILKNKESYLTKRMYASSFKITNQKQDKK